MMMGRTIIFSRLVVCWTLLLLSLTSCHSRNWQRRRQSNIQANAATSADFKQFDKTIIDFMKQQNVPGASVAVSKNGKILYKQGYGSGGFAGPVQTDSLFRIASISKTVSAMGALRLSDMGKLSLEALVFGARGILKQYSPTLHGDRRILNIKVKHLIQHSGGWDRQVTPDPTYKTVQIAKSMGVPRPISQDNLIRYMMGQRLDFTPGTKIGYSNIGYLILGRVIEKVTGREYVTFMRSVLKLAGITRMNQGLMKKEQARPGEVQYFYLPSSYRMKAVWDDNLMVPPPYGGFNMAIRDANGGWIASAADLVTFMNGLDGSTGYRFIKPSTFQTMLSRPQYYKGASHWYSYGLSVWDNGASYSHNGLLYGSKSLLAHTKSSGNFTYAIILNLNANGDLPSLMENAIRKVSAWFPTLSRVPSYADSLTADGKVLVKLMVPETEFQSHFNLAKERYMLVSRTSFEYQGKTYFNAVWKRNDKRELWFSNRRLTQPSYEVLLHSRPTYRIVDLMSFVSKAYGNRLQHAAVYAQNGGPQTKAFLGLTTTEHESQFKSLTSQGWRLVSLSPIEYQGRLLITSVYEKVNGGANQVVHYGLTQSDFGIMKNDQATLGRSIKYMYVYMYQNQQFYAGIWGSPYEAVYTWRGDTKSGTIQKMIDNGDENWHCHGVGTYVVNSYPQFAAYWTK